MARKLAPEQRRYIEARVAYKHALAEYSKRLQPHTPDTYDSDEAWQAYALLEEQVLRETGLDRARDELNRATQALIDFFRAWLQRNAAEYAKRQDIQEVLRKHHLPWVHDRLIDLALKVRAS